MKTQIQFVTSLACARFDRLRWRLFLWLIPALWLAQEKRRLERIARDKGASKSQSVAIATAYINSFHEGH